MKDNKNKIKYVQPEVLDMTVSFGYCNPGVPGAPPNCFPTGSGASNCDGGSVPNTACGEGSTG